MVRKSPPQKNECQCSGPILGGCLQAACCESYKSCGPIISCRQRVKLCKMTTNERKWSLMRTWTFSNPSRWPRSVHETAQVSNNTIDTKVYSNNPPVQLNGSCQIENTHKRKRSTWFLSSHFKKIRRLAVNVGCSAFSVKQNVKNSRRY